MSRRRGLFGGGESGNGGGGIVVGVGQGLGNLLQLIQTGDEGVELLPPQLNLGPEGLESLLRRGEVALLSGESLIGGGASGELANLGGHEFVLLAMLSNLLGLVQGTSALLDPRLRLSPLLCDGFVSTPIVLQLPLAHLSHGDGLAHGVLDLLEEAFNLPRPLRLPTITTASAARLQATLQTNDVLVEETDPSIVPVHFPSSL